jgi:NAD(P)-dependent dehydrogenase (short-subunit alcohol dehydrogenase family)
VLPRLDGKVAIVTGGSRGIGCAIGAALAAAGAKVMLSARTDGDLRLAADAMTGDVAWFAADAGDPEAAEACVTATVDRFGSLDILVNNAATDSSRGTLMDLDLSLAEDSLRVNVLAALVWTQCAWRASMEKTGGTVINVASVGAIAPVNPIMAFYSTTKAALLHLTKGLARELAPRVRVNAICPGIVKTDMTRAVWEHNEAQMAATMPMQRLGETADIASAALFLASDASSWTTGATIVVDGGLMLGRLSP